MIKSKNKLNAVVGVIMAVAFLTVVGFNQTGSIYAQSETDRLTLLLSTTKSRYLQLEPIYFKFKLSNQTIRDVRWQGLLSLGQDMDIVIQTAGGEERTLDGSKMERVPSLPFSNILSSGRDIESGGLIAGVSLFEYAFPQPGTYQVRVKFTYKKITGDTVSRETVTSNPISITIDAPEGVNQQAYTYIKDILERARRERRSTNELLVLQENFVNNYGTSVYAKKAILDLASRYVIRGEDLKALRQLCKVSGDNGYYSDYVEKTVHLIGVRLFPPDLIPLPENLPMPVRPHPCLRVINQM